MLGKSKNSQGKAMRIKVGKTLKKQAINNEKINVSEAMREAGYAPSTINSRTADIVKTREVQDEMKDFTDKLDGIKIGRAHV